MAGVRRNKCGKSYAVESTLLVRTAIFDSKMMVVLTNVVRVDSVKQGTALRSNTRRKHVLELAKARYLCA